MQRYFIKFAYNGTAYHGWQNQPNAVSVQEVLECKMTQLMHTTITVVGAGRTDAGVHAECMYAHFDLNEPIDDCNHIVKRLNAYLPNDIEVFTIYPVDADMHARFSAKSRTYRYQVRTSKDVFDFDYRMKVDHDTDFVLMNEAASHLADYIDFTSFSKLHTDVKTNNCHIMRAEWVMESPTRWSFYIQADRFLRNMVRAIVGTLLEVGAHKLTVEQFCAIIEKKDRCSAGSSAPAKGLFLIDVEY